MVQGWPDRKHEIPQNLAKYWNIRHELSEAEGLIFKDHQLVIPTAMTSNMLNLIHESHLWIEKCKARARAILFWPGMSKDIYEKLSKCATCTTYRRRNQKEPMIAHPIPERPWQKLRTDLCECKGKNCLVVVDYYSKFIETALLPNKTPGTVIRHLKSIFAKHGIPEELVSNNMPSSLHSSSLNNNRISRSRTNDKSTKPLPPLEIGENIHLRQDSIWVPPNVSGLGPDPRLYIFTTSDGQQYRRNHRDLLKTNGSPSTIIEQTEDIGEEQPSIIPQQPDLDLIRDDQ
jgi:hypothetical protein